MNRQTGRLARWSRYIAPALAVLTMLLAADSAWSQSKAVPRQGYYFGKNAFINGEYRDALRTFQSEWRGAIKTAQSRWIDSICHHTMMGECYYQMGNNGEALDQYNAALNLYVGFSDWMLRVQFPPTIRTAMAGQIKNVPWATSARNPRYGIFPDVMSVSQGRINNNNVIAQGGVVQQAVSYPVAVSEIAYCTALALRRRRELIGPYGPHDPFSATLVTTASGNNTQPGHWSQAWTDVILGLAYAATDKDAQAKVLLQRSVVAGGEFDHPLTAMALFELGRIELTQANFDIALNYFQEASIAAFRFDDATLAEESLRYGTVTYLMANKQGIFPPLAPAAQYARQKRLGHLHASTALCLAENTMVRGDLRAGDLALRDAFQAMARTQLPDSRVGARFNFLSALSNYKHGKISDGDASLDLAMAFQRTGSFWLWHITMSEQLYLKGAFSAREAFDIFKRSLREPGAADWLSDPMESMSVLVTPHSSALEHWFDVAIARKEYEAALDIADLTRRHRFFSTTAMGGRLLSLVWVMEGPDEAVPNSALLERQDLLAQFPRYAELSQAATRLREDMRSRPLVAQDATGLRTLTDNFTALGQTYLEQEAILREMAVRRFPCNMAFPPLRRTEDIRAALPEKTGAVVFFATPRKIHAFMLTRNTFLTWEVGSLTTVYPKVVKLLRELGHLEKNRVLPHTVLSEKSWRRTSRDLLVTLLEGAQTDFPGELEELVVVPDGALWYVPFELLGASPDGKSLDSLITRVRVRYAPTAGLAVPDSRGRPPSPQTYVALGRMYPQEPEEMTEGAFLDLANVISGTYRVPDKPLPAPMSLYASSFDRLIVLDEIPEPEAGPYSFSPVPQYRGDLGGNFDGWLPLPWQGPDVVMLPCYHTAAENMMKKITPAAAGSDVFLPVTGLMAAGARTVVLSRWRTGGKVCVDLMREFAQELPHTSAADAWQRSVMLAADTPLRREMEPRLEIPPTVEPPKADHPFFWSAYMVVDSGTPPKKADGNEDDVLKPLTEKQKKLLEKRKEQ